MLRYSTIGNIEYTENFRRDSSDCVLSLCGDRLDTATEVGVLEIKFAIFQNPSKSAFLLFWHSVKTMTGTTTGCSNISLWWNLLTRQTELDRSQHLNVSCKNTLTKEPVVEVYFSRCSSFAFSFSSSNSRQF